MTSAELKIHAQCSDTETTVQLIAFCTLSGHIPYLDCYLRVRWHKYNDQMLLMCAVYVFLGDPLALVDFMRALDNMNLNDGEYVVIAVQDDTFEPTNQRKYFKQCKS